MVDNLVKTIVGGIQTTMAYDIRGNKIQMNDPDMGPMALQIQCLRTTS